MSEAPELDRRDIASVVEGMLVEIDGCEIRTAVLEEIEGEDGKTPVYGNPKKKDPDRLRGAISQDFFEDIEPAIRDKIKNYLIELLIERLDSMNQTLLKISRFSQGNVVL